MQDLCRHMIRFTLLLRHVLISVNYKHKNTLESDFMKTSFRHRVL